VEKSVYGSGKAWKTSGIFFSFLFSFSRTLWPACLRPRLGRKLERSEFTKQLGSVHWIGWLKRVVHWAGLDNRRVIDIDESIWIVYCSVTEKRRRRLRRTW